MTDFKRKTRWKPLWEFYPKPIPRTQKLKDVWCDECKKYKQIQMGRTWSKVEVKPAKFINYDSFLSKTLKAYMPTLIRNFDMKQSLYRLFTESYIETFCPHDPRMLWSIDTKRMEQDE